MPSNTIIDSYLSSEIRFHHRILTAEKCVQFLARVEHPVVVSRECPRAEIQEPGFLAASAPFPHWHGKSTPIGPDFPGDLSAEQFQDPFAENCDGGLWEEDGADAACISDPFDGLAFGEPIGSPVDFW